MNNFERQLNDTASTVSLSKAEKGAMKERLATFIEYKPVRGGLSEEGKRYSAGPNLWQVSFVRMFRVKYVPAALILGLVFIGGGGVSLAANGALPGELLYPIKVKVNEEIRVALTGTDESKTAWEVERAGRRLEEAEALATAGKFDERARVVVSSTFQTHMERITANLELLDEGDFPAIELQARLEGTLDAHAEILASLSGEEANDTTRVFAGEVAEERRLIAGRTSFDTAIIGTVALRTEIGTSEDDGGISREDDASFKATSFAPPSDSMSMSSEESTSVLRAEEKREEDGSREKARVVAERLRDVVSTRIETADKTLTRLEKAVEVDGHTAMRIRADLDATRALLADGERFLEEGEYEVAGASYRSALSSAERINILLKVGVRLKTPAAIDFPAVNDGGDNPVSSINGGDSDDAPTDGRTLTIRHSFRDGTHTYRGVVEVPTPCHALSVEARVAESFPEQILLAFTTRSGADVCIQMIGEKEFSVDVSASERATVAASLNGERLALIIVEQASEVGSSSTGAENDAEESADSGLRVVPRVRLPL